ncbi:Clp protease N-terminal domain-containing protein [Nonomuraea sp. NPDC050153]|uniref:Clp protease N-terminal domain-containing protein n=1 Tax=Nonomuraea sp. NPDC050153 TaxID=3364359 RepID=UPI0037B83EE8
MPKINVYLPDELAEAVKQAGVPVSAVCQRALEQAVRRVTAIRETVLSDLDLQEPTGALTHLTPTTRTVLKTARDQALADGAAAVGTGHLLGAMLSEGTNLALHVLRAMEIDPEQVKRDLARHLPASGEAGAPEPGHFGGTAANALEFAVTEATSLGHNYVGCEHLLLGLVAEPDGTAGQVLRGLGVEPRLARRAVVAALAGYVHLRAQAQQSGEGGQNRPAAVQAMLSAAIRQELQPLVQRLERLEAHAGLDA